jgi:hypothetical protein
MLSGLRRARADGARYPRRVSDIAYQVVGNGPVDLVYTPGIWSNLGDADLIRESADGLTGE